MSAVLLNIVIGLATTALSGGSVWLWQRGKNSRLLRRKAEFFGLESGGECVIIMNHSSRMDGTMSHSDIQALIEVSDLAHELGSKVSVRYYDEFRENNGGRTEFCIGGRNSNLRTLGHLESYVPGVTIETRTPSEPQAIVVGTHRFQRDRNKREYALVAKFTTPGSTCPVMVICGQTAVANRGAIHFLKREYREVAKTVASIKKFCIIIRVSAIDTYDYQAASLDSDVSADAFTGH